MLGYYRKRGNTWTFTVEIPRDPITGKRRQKTGGGFATKKDAQIAAAEIIKEVTDGTYAIEENITFADFAKDWLRLYEKSAKISSVRIRAHEINKLSGLLADVRMRDVTKYMYQNLLIRLKDQGLSHNTLSGVHVAASMIFKKAVEFEVIKANPTAFAKVPKKIKTVEELERRDKVAKYMERDQLVAFINTAQAKGLERDFEIFLTLAYTGLRVGELCALKWSDINFEAKTLSITKTYFNATNHTPAFMLLTPKTNASIRILDLDPLVLDALNHHKFWQDDLIRTNPNYYPGDFVFAKQGRYAGYPEHLKTINTRMARILKLAGLPSNLTPHSLRHTHTSLLAEAGVGLFEIMDRLGHQDDETTKQVYLHVTNTMKKEAVDKFAILMGNSLKTTNPSIEAISRGRCEQNVSISQF